MSKEITLSRGRVAIVDDADYGWLSQWKWLYITSGYAVRRHMVNKRQRATSMHRLIMGFPDIMEVDHINGNKLDNRRCNLRLATTSQNQQNRTVTPHTSIFKGVTRSKWGWKSTIMVRGKSVHLGYHATQRIAADVYNLAAIRYFGEFCHLNDLTLIDHEKDPPVR